MSKNLALNLTGVAKLDNGKIDAAFGRHMQTIVRDCQSRPGDRKPRRLRLTVSIVPIVDDLGNLGEARISFSMDTNVPKSTTKDYVMGAKQDGTLMFNPDNPEDVRQGTLDLDGRSSE